MSSLLGELRAYVGLDADDEARLVALEPKLAPHLAAIADRFYDAIERTPGAASLITDRAQVIRLKLTLIEWMSTGLRGPYDDRFYDKRARIGRRHIQIRMPQHYMFTAMNVVRTAYHELLSRLIADLGERAATDRAVDRLLDLELALMLRSFQVDSEERLLARERGLQAEKLAAMQTMTAGLAHEVRNPLNAAKLQLELLERRLRRAGDDQRLIEPVELAHLEITRLTNLLNEFLSFARPQQLSASDHDVVDIARAVVEAERPLAESAGVALRLVRQDGPVPAEIDAGKIHQAIQNLVRNAIEAVTDRDPARVDVDVREIAHQIVVEVRDTGPGVPPDVQARIYEPFFSTKPTGTGMGLSIVHTVVGLHGGQLAIDTGPQGTRFFMHLQRHLG